MSKAAARLLDVIDTVAVADSPLAVGEISELTGLNKSTSSRILKLLAERDYVTRDEDSRRYRAGPTLLGLSATIAKRSELIRIAHPYLEGVRNESGETASLHLRVGSERLCIDAVDRFPPQIHIQPLGIRNPLFIGTSGKVIIANLASNEQDELCAAAVEAGVKLADLEVEIAEAQEQGYLVGLSHKTQKHITVSAPLFRDDDVFGSVTVTGPQERWTKDAAREYAARLKEQTGMISAVVTSAKVFVYQMNGKRPPTRT